jgi:hypothetical protein
MNRLFLIRRFKTFVVLGTGWDDGTVDDVSRMSTTFHCQIRL